MSEDWSIPAPAFKAEEALVGLKRQLRDLKPLAERGARFELRGVTVIELSASATQIDVRLAQRPVANPNWTVQALKSSQDVRKLIDQMRQQLRRWEGDE